MATVRVLGNQQWVEAFVAGTKYAHADDPRVELLSIVLLETHEVALFDDARRPGNENIQIDLRGM